MKPRPDRRSRSPAETFGRLFEDVALAAIHEDGKDWADPHPLRAPAAILRQYKDTPPQTDADLRAFVDANFSFDSWRPEPTPVVGLDLRTAIDALWPALTRTSPTARPYSSMLPLPHPYLAPGDGSPRPTIGIPISPCWAPAMASRCARRPTISLTSSAPTGTFPTATAPTISAGRSRPSSSWSPA